MTRLLCELERGPATVDDLVDATGMTAGSIRAQLSQLRQIGVVHSTHRVPVSVATTRMRPVYELRTAAPLPGGRE